MLIVEWSNRTAKELCWPRSAAKHSLLAPAPRRMEQRTGQDKHILIHEEKKRKKQDK